MRTSLLGKYWKFREHDEEQVRDLSDALGVSSLTAAVLRHRKITSREEGRIYLNAGLSDLSNPLEIPGIVPAAERMVAALERKDRICIFGDYDVDGVTATALLVRILNRLGADVTCLLPNRLKDGYGLHRAVIPRIVETGAKLLITVDNGISAREEIAQIRKAGIDVIVTDHHEPPEVLPETPYLVNPKMEPARAGHFAMLSGVGLAFALLVAVRALLREKNSDGRRDLPNLREVLDLVALGTIGDVVPLVGENRILVRHGLAEIGRSRNRGIRALVNAAGIRGSVVTPGQVGFALAPRINAAGRLGDAMLALRMLVSDDPEEVEELAAMLNTENLRRREIEKKIFAEALERMEREGSEGKVIVLASEDWHPGVIGIVASRMVERFYRPTILIARKNGMGVGSGRSISGFSLYRALEAGGEYLQGFGGHEVAAGLTVAWERIPAFRDAVNHYAEETLDAETLVPSISIDDSLVPEQVTPELLGELEKLKPFGIGNPEPVFQLSGVRPQSVCIVGEAHLRFQVPCGKGLLNVIGFNLGKYADPLTAAPSSDLLCHLRFNDFNGKRSVQAVLVDIRPEVHQGA
ncbi:MAG: single-stranded-DNA-specific exonuclease RecJ [Deltaproteobacteria bacterium]|nr:single-stranded-DNA-specific exonuclease RecJ [Deltaproteobacteria bacterium]